MNYDPTTYWPERYRRQGETYVAKGGRMDSYEAQIATIVPCFEHLPTEGCVLDFGCGPGRFRSWLESHGLDYEGVDLIPGFGTMEVQDVEAEGFDAAVAIYVLQHIVQDDAYMGAVETLHRALRPGGSLLVVDHGPVDEYPDEHMHPRCSDILAMTFRGPWDWWWVDDSHWGGVFVK